jgi:hypothetical protein
MRCRGLDNPRIEDSIDRLTRVLGQLQTRVDDPIGTRFIEGTVAEILHAPPEAASRPLFVIETVRPAVFVAERRVVSPQVILGFQERSSS